MLWARPCARIWIYFTTKSNQQKFKWIASKVWRERPALLNSIGRKAHIYQTFNHILCRVVLREHHEILDRLRFRPENIWHNLLVSCNVVVNNDTSNKLIFFYERQVSFYSFNIFFELLLQLRSLWSRKIVYKIEQCTIIIMIVICVCPHTFRVFYFGAFLQLQIKRQV